MCINWEYHSIKTLYIIKKKFKKKCSSLWLAFVSSSIFFFSPSIMTFTPNYRTLTNQIVECMLWLLVI